MLHPPAIRLSHLHPDLEKIIVLCRRFGYLNPVSRHQRSPSQQRKLSFGLFLARQFRVCRDLRRSVNHRNRRGEPVRRPLPVSVRAFRSSPSCHRRAVQTSLPPRSPPAVRQRSFDSTLNPQQNGRQETPFHGVRRLPAREGAVGDVGAMEGPVEGNPVHARIGIVNGLAQVCPQTRDGEDAP